MAGFDMSGFDDLLAVLEEMGEDSIKIQDKILMKAALPVYEDMVANAPVLTGFGKSELSIGYPKTKNGVSYVRIGLEKSDMSTAYYLKFSEWGTSRQPAKPFMQPALEKNRGRIKEIMYKELREELLL